MSQAIAMGVSAIKIGTYGNGVPATVLNELPLPYKGSVAFNFSDPSEIKIETEGSMDPLYSTFVKNDTDYVEFAIPTPENEVIQMLGGGIHDTENGKDIWKEATSIASINKTFVMETEVHNGKKVIYTIVNGKIMAKLNQAPGAEQPELLLVRVYKNAAITSDGKRNYAFSREVIEAEE